MTVKVQQKVLKIYKPLFTTDKRYVILIGGRGSGKSTAMSQEILARLLAPEYYRSALMRFIYKDVRHSIWQEFKDRIDEHDNLDKIIDMADHTITARYGENLVQGLGFRKSSGDQKSKLKSLASYTNVYIEEADEISEEDFKQLDDTIRTKKGQNKIVLALNPPHADHWLVQRFFNLVPTEKDGYYKPEIRKEFKDQVELIYSTYHTNRHNLSPSTIKNYENYKTTSPHYYWNQIMGYIPQIVEGQIYTGWRQIDEIPEQARRIRRGLDFGYSIDPTALIDIYEYNGGYILDERIYRKGMSNKAIADFLIADDPDTLVIADSAEPKSIDEIQSYGVNIIGAAKGQGSVLQGIQYVQTLNISVTRRSHNLWKAYLNYTWQSDGLGGFVQKPDDSNHEWSNSMDAVRYGFNGGVAGADLYEDIESEVDDDIFVNDEIRY